MGSHTGGALITQDSQRGQRAYGRSLTFVRDDNAMKSRARMRFGVRFLQSFDRHVRVNLRRRKTGVAEQRLDAAQVCATIKHVSGKTVAKFVWADRNRNRSVS